MWRKKVPKRNKLQVVYRVYEITYSRWRCTFSFLHESRVTIIWVDRERVQIPSPGVSGAFTLKSIRLIRRLATFQPAAEDGRISSSRCEARRVITNINQCTDTRSLAMTEEIRRLRMTIGRQRQDTSYLLFWCSIVHQCSLVERLHSVRVWVYIYTNTCICVSG